ELSKLLAEHLAEVETAPALSSSITGAALTVGYLGDGTFDILFADQPGFTCVGAGTGIGWLVVELLLPDASGTVVPMLYAQEVVVDCLGADGGVQDAGPPDGGTGGDDGAIDAGDDGAIDAGPDLDASVEQDAEIDAGA